MGDVEHGYQYIASDCKEFQLAPRGRWLKVASALLGGCCFILLSSIALTETTPTSTDKLAAPEELASAADKNVENAADEGVPVMVLFALPLQGASADLENMTLGKAGDLHLSSESGKANTDSASPEDKLAGKLADRTLVVFPLSEDTHKGTNLDSATLGKTDAQPEKLKKGKGKKDAGKKDSGADVMKSLEKALKGFSVSALAASAAECATMPFDVAKVRLQTEAAAAAGATKKYTSMLGTLATVGREEGIGSLYKGIVPGVQRQVVFGGIRLGLYDPIRDSIKDVVCGKNYTGNAPLSVKCAAGFLSGAIAMVIASPTELVKVRMQSEGAKLLAGGTPRYPNAWAAYPMIVKEEGLLGLWRGIVPNVMANSIINAAELACMDTTKDLLLGIGMKEGPGVNCISGFAAGLGAVFFGSPADVVKSRVFADTTGQYKNFFDCFIKTAKEGLPAFYQGALPSLGRQGGGNMVIFLGLGELKSFAQKIGYLEA